MRFGASLARRILLIALALAASGCEVARTRPPEAWQPPGPSPAELLAGRKLHAPPPLTGSGPAAHESVRRFIDWAGFSTLDEREDGRRVIQGARDNVDVAATLCDEIGAAAYTDHSRALLVIAILGEMRSRRGGICLHDLVQLPLPTTGTEANGELVEATALAMLQAKAIDGLAYLATQASDAEVLQAIAQHPSVIVRAEAIDAYLWNHRDKPAAARAAVARYVRPGEEIYLDRVRRDEGESAESFNAKLDAYLKAHPEVQPPAPPIRR